ncbi:MAG: transglycosylase domain-containing protein [Bacteroidota bacterium]
MSDQQPTDNKFISSLQQLTRSFLEKAWKTLQSKTFWKRLSLGSLIAFGILILGVALLFALVSWGAFGTLPDKEQLSKIKNNVASEVYTADGVLMGKFFLVNRTEVEFEEIPEYLINALVATEDARFFEHKGVDTKSMLRVMFKSILLGDKSAGGGSTISQQFAKNVFPRKTYGPLTMPVNKIKEMIVAKRLEKIYSKNEILSLYLNTVPFGESVFGVDAAAHRYFGKDAKDLKLEEAAVLVGMLKATTYYNPKRHPERSKVRRDVVIAQMANAHYMTAEDADLYMSKELKTNYQNVTRKNGMAPYFRQVLAKELQKYFEENPKADGTAWNLYTDGLKIYTTIESRLQRHAESSVKAHMASLQKTFNKHWSKRKIWKTSDPAIQKAMKQSSRYKRLKAQGMSEEEILKNFNTKVKMNVWTWQGNKEMEFSPLDSIMYYKSFLHAGMMAVDPNSGHVKAWVGGINHEHFKYDHVTSNRQVGSTFKPLIYAAAIEQGLVDPCEYIINEKVTYRDYEDWTPGNSDGKYDGYYSMKGGLVNSVNTVSAAIMMKMGVSEAYDFVQRFGFESDIPEQPSLVLGTAELTVKEMVGAYTTFSNRGLRSKPIFISKIEDAKGNLIVKYPQKPESKQIMDPETAKIMAHMLTTVVDSGTARRLRTRYKLTADIGGKTGTTQDQTDGWFMGITNDLVVGVWVGGDEGKVRFRSLSLGQGANTALPIYGNFMKKVHSDFKYRKWKRNKLSKPGASAMNSLDCPMYVLEVPDEGILDPIQDLLDRIKEYREKRKEMQDGRKKNRWKDLFKKKKSQSDSDFLEYSEG